MLSGADTEAVQVQTVSVIKDFIQIVTQLHSELLTTTAFKLGRGVCWAETEGKTAYIMYHISWWFGHMAQPYWEHMQVSEICNLQYKELQSQKHLFSDKSIFSTSNAGFNLSCIWKAKDDQVHLVS